MSCWHDFIYVYTHKHTHTHTYALVPQANKLLQVVHILEMLLPEIVNLRSHIKAPSNHALRLWSDNNAYAAAVEFRLCGYDMIFHI